MMSDEDLIRAIKDFAAADEAGTISPADNRGLMPCELADLPWSLPFGQRTYHDVMRRVVGLLDSGLPKPALRVYLALVHPEPEGAGAEPDIGPTEAAMVALAELADNPDLLSGPDRPLTEREVADLPFPVGGPASTYTYRNALALAVTEYQRSKYSAAIVIYRALDHGDGGSACLGKSIAETRGIAVTDANFARVLRDKAVAEHWHDPAYLPAPDELLAAHTPLTISAAFNAADLSSLTLSDDDGNLLASISKRKVRLDWPGLRALADSDDGAKAGPLQAIARLLCHVLDEGC